MWSFRITSDLKCIWFFGYTKENVQFMIQFWWTGGIMELIMSNTTIAKELGRMPQI